MTLRELRDRVNQICEFPALLDTAAVVIGMPNGGQFAVEDIGLDDYSGDEELIVIRTAHAAADATVATGQGAR